MKLLALTSLVVLLPVGAHADGGPTTPVQVENAIRHHIASLRAVEYPEARKVTAVEGTTVAIYTAEGACAGFSLRAKPGTCSNNWVRYMVALSGGRTTRPLEVGGKGDLSDTSTTISEGVIEVTGLSFGLETQCAAPQCQKRKSFGFLRQGLARSCVRRNEPCVGVPGGADSKDANRPRRGARHPSADR